MPYLIAPVLVDVETLAVASTVVNRPVDAVVAPIDTALNANTVVPSAADVAPKVILEFTRPEFGRPVAFVNVIAEGVPKLGVTSVGLVANTRAPEPVSSVMAAAKLAYVGVAKKVATPVPKPLTPVLIGKPVALVNVTDVGVPKIGVTNVGEVDKTTFPVPVEVVTPVPPLVTGKVPVVRAEVDVAYTAPPNVNEVNPVPPLVVANVPDNVIAPVLDVLGVNPVVPALNDVTPPVNGCHDAVVPFDVRI